MSDIALTDDQYFSSLEKFLQNAYQELETYEVVLGEDFQTTGVTRFLAVLNQARQWGTRVLSMMMEARRGRNRASFVAKGKRALFENACILYVRDNRESMPKGLSAEERKSLAALEKNSMREDADRWEFLANELRSLIEILDSKHKELLSAKSDLRAQLWAVKLQGLLGELHTEAADEDSPVNNWMARAAAANKNVQPSFAVGERTVASRVQAVGHDLDDLLGTNGGKS